MSTVLPWIPESKPDKELYEELVLNKAVCIEESTPADKIVEVVYEVIYAPNTGFNIGGVGLLMILMSILMIISVLFVGVGSKRSRF